MDLKREGFGVVEHRASVEAHAGHTHDRKLDCQHLALLAGGKIARGAVNPRDGAVRESLCVKLGRFLGACRCTTGKLRSWPSVCLSWFVSGATALRIEDDTDSPGSTTPGELNCEDLLDRSLGFLGRASPALPAGQLAMAESDAAIGFANDFQGRRVVRGTEVEAWLGRNIRMPPPIEDDPRDIPPGVESCTPEQHLQLPADLSLEIAKRGAEQLAAGRRGLRADRHPGLGESYVHRQHGRL